MEKIDSVAAALRANNIPFLVAEPLARHTTFKIGGAAAVFCTPQSALQLEQALAVCRAQQARWYLLGKGSNVLFADEGYDGVVLHVGEALSDIAVEGNVVTAMAGAALADVCLAAAEHGLTGMEFAYGIPGSVGGAVYMNAGAYGGEMKDVLHSATFYDETGARRTLLAQKLSLGYRTSVFEQEAWCIESAAFLLKQGDAAEVRALMQDYAQRRAEKQPLDMPSAGSTFKRPAGAFAGALIDQCGLRGYAVGGAAISTKHCGFVVNTGCGTCEDVLALTDEVCAIVKRETGYELEKEVRVVR
ncbi:MAG: UDP-N-acetylmuramate dehydrogenase [Ruthenibacterium sp.]